MPSHRPVNFVGKHALVGCARLRLREAEALRIGVNHRSRIEAER